MTAPNITELSDVIPSGGLKRAEWFRIYRCPDCPFVHVVLFDGSNKPFAQFVIGEDNLDRLYVDAVHVLRPNGSGDAQAH